MKEPQRFRPVLVIGPFTSFENYGDPNEQYMKVEMQIRYDPTNVEHLQAIHTFQRNLDTFGEKQKQMFSHTITQRVSYF